MRRGAGLRQDLRERRTWRTRTLGLHVRWTDCGGAGAHSAASARDYYDALVRRRLPAFSPNVAQRGGAR